MRRLARHLNPALKVRTRYLFDKFKNFLLGSKSNRLSLNDMSRKRGDFACSEQHARILLTKPDQWPSLTISVVTFNGEKWLTNFVKSLSDQDYPKEKLYICFVDHGSTDGTWDFIEKFRNEQCGVFAGIRCDRRPNKGFGSGHDFIIRNAATERVLVTNVDLELLPDTLTQLVAFAEVDSDDVASWEARQIPFEHPKNYDPVTLETAWSSHACILIDRNKYLEVGGYEKMIFMYGEDVELSYRFRSHGYTLRYIPDAEVLHYSYESVGQIKPLQFAGSTLANTYIRLRYGSISDVIEGYLLQLMLLVVGGGFSGSRKIVASNLVKSLINAKKFLHYPRKRGAHFSFYGYDYEKMRDGAFYVLEPKSRGVNPLISVITRTVDGRGFLLLECIASVLNQTYPNIEHLVVEDGGASASKLVGKVAQRFEDKKGYSIRHIEAPKKGRSHAGNLGLACAKGEYIVFLDDDDLIYSDHIEVLFTALRKSHAHASYGLAWEVLTRIDLHSESYEEDVYQTLPAMRQEFDRKLLFEQNYLPLQAVLFSRSLYESYGGFEEDMDCLEDWVLWCRYAADHEFAYVPKTTSLYRTPSDTQERVKRTKLMHNADGYAKNRLDSILNKAVNKVRD